MIAFRRFVRTLIGLAGLVCFSIGGGFGLAILLGELFAKLSAGVFGNGLNEAGAPLIIGLFGSLAYLLASIDARLEQRT